MTYSYKFLICGQSLISKPTLRKRTDPHITKAQHRCFPASLESPGGCNINPLPQVLSCGSNMYLLFDFGWFVQPLLVNCHLVRRQEDISLFKTHVLVKSREKMAESKKEQNVAFFLPDDLWSSSSPSEALKNIGGVDADGAETVKRDTSLWRACSRFLVWCHCDLW